MEVTDVRIRRAKAPGKKLAVAAVTFDEEFVVHDIKIIQTEKGLIVTMPSVKSNDGTYKDIAHPINQIMRGKVEKAVLFSYNESPQQEKAADIAAKIAELEELEKLRDDEQEFEEINAPEHLIVGALI